MCSHCVFFSPKDCLRVSVFVGDGDLDTLGLRVDAEVARGGCGRRGRLEVVSDGVVRRQGRPASSPCSPHRAARPASVGGSASTSRRRWATTRRLAGVEERLANLELVDAGAEAELVSHDHLMIRQSLKSQGHVEKTVRRKRQ